MGEVEHLRLAVDVYSTQHCFMIAASSWFCVTQFFGLPCEPVGLGVPSRRGARRLALDFMLLRDQGSSGDRVKVGETVLGGDAIDYPEVGLVGSGVYHVRIGDKYQEVYSALFNWLYWQGSGIWGRPAGNPLTPESPHWQEWAAEYAESRREFVGRGYAAMPAFEQPLSVTGCLSRYFLGRSGKTRAWGPVRGVRRPRIFLCYSREDNDIRKRLREHLLYRDEIECFDDSSLRVGEEWPPILRHHISEADIVVLILSAYFYRNAYVVQQEMPLVWQRYSANACLVVPVYVTSLKPSSIPIYDANPNFRWQVTDLQSPNGPRRPLRLPGTDRLDESTLAACADEILERAASLVAQRKSS